MRSKQRGMTVIEAMIAVLALAALVAVPSCVGCKRDYSAGKRAGVIVKFSKRGLRAKLVARLRQRGLFVQSYEGTMHVGNAATATGAATWDFSVADSDDNRSLINQIGAAQNSGVPVLISYRQWAWSPFWIDTSYEATSLDQPAKAQ